MPHGRIHLVRAFVRIALACLIASALAGCGRSQESRVRETVKRYNELLAEGYRTQNMSALREVATEVQAEDEYIHMSSLGEGGIRLIPTLKSMQFQEVSVEGTAALVRTREIWDYTQESIVTGKTVLIQPDLEYDLAWDLVRSEDSKWYVSDVRAIEATALAPPTVVDTITPLPRQP